MVHSCLWMSTTEADKGCHCWCLVPQPDRETLEASYKPLMGIFEGSALLAPQARMPVFQGLAVVVGSTFFIKSPCVNKCFTITFKSKHVQSGCSINTSWGAITCWPPTYSIWKLHLEQGDKWLRECFVVLALQWYFGAKSPKQAHRILLKMVSIPVAINPSNSLSWISQTIKCSHTYVISFDAYSYEVGREEQFSLSRWRKGLSEIFGSHGLWQVAKQGIGVPPVLSLVPFCFSVRNPKQQGPVAPSTSLFCQRWHLRRAWIRVLTCSHPDVAVRLVLMGKCV